MKHKKLFLILPLVIILVGVIKLIIIINTPLGFQVLDRLLKENENHILDTTDEKKLNRENYYQIVGEKLYINQETGLTEYDYTTSKEKVLFDIYMPDTYQIINNKIYYCKMNDNDNGNDMDLICRSLDGNNKKKILKNISDFFFNGDEMIFYRYNHTGEQFYLYQEGEEHTFLFANEQYSDDGYYPVRPLFCWEDNIVFQGEYNLGYLAGYNLKTNQWKEYFNMQNTPKKLYYKKLDVQCIQNYMFVHGTMCDSTKTAIGGEYFLDDAQENGVWRINLITNERKQITQKVYSGGIYVLNGKLYGIDGGKYYLLYDI